MSQVLLDKLTKKNKEFLHIATHQLLKDGKSDEEVKAILEEIIPRVSLPVLSMGHQLTGLLLSLLKSAMMPSIPSKMMIQNG